MVVHLFYIDNVRFSKLLNHFMRIFVVKRILVQLILQTSLNLSVARITSRARFS